MSLCLLVRAYLTLIVSYLSSRPERLRNLHCRPRLILLPVHPPCTRGVREIRQGRASRPCAQRDSCRVHLVRGWDSSQSTHRVSSSLVTTERVILNNLSVSSSRYLRGPSPDARTPPRIRMPDLAKNIRRHWAVSAARRKLQASSFGLYSVSSMSMISRSMILTGRQCSGPARSP